MLDKQFSRKIIIWYFLIVIGMTIVALVIFVKACIVSFLEGDKWREIGLRPIRFNKEVLAERGNIYSTNYELMATSEYEYRLFLDFCADGIKEDTLKKYVTCLAKDLHKMFPKKSIEEYRKHILNGWEMRSTHRRNYRLFDHTVNPIQWKIICQMPYFNKGRNCSGLYSKEFIKRLKPYGTLASRTIGNVYREIGKGGENGLEKYYDKILRGKSGISTRKKIYGQYIDVLNVKPFRGKDIVSTIDISIQDIVEKALLERLKELDAESGTVIIMEVSTGKVRAISNFGKKMNNKKEWGEIKNYAVSDLSEPGSTFKVISMIALLESGLVHPNDYVNTGNGIMLIAGEYLKDHNFKRGGYGKITASKSIRYSSNIGVALLTEYVYGQNPGRFVDAINKIGINQDIGLEIPGYSIPYIRHPKDKTVHWAKSTLPWMSFGYGVQISPIYILTFFNAIANNGKLIKPIFVREIIENGKILKQKTTKIINPKICSSVTLSSIRQMLYDVVNMPDGTGKLAYSNKVCIAGKTGTVQLSKGKKGYKSGDLSYQVSFCGYFPAQNPQYSGIVVIRKPKYGIISGGAICGTLFKDIAESIYLKNNISNADSFPTDTINSLYPSIISGNINTIVNILNYLKIPYQDRSKENLLVISKWDSINKRIILYDKEKIQSSFMPNLKGVGAKDAIFTLENMELQVKVIGRGKVIRQSIPPNAKVFKGQKVILEFCKQ